MSTTRQTVKFHRAPAGARLRSLPRMNAEARKLLSSREEDSFEQGRRVAEQSLSQQLVLQRNEMIELQNGVLKSLGEVIPQIIRDTEKSLVELALATAERLVAGLPIDRAMVEAAVREALAQVEDGSRVHVLLHPEDLALLQKDAGGGLAAEARSGDQLILEPSPEATRGGCIVRTRFGDIDALRETKLEKVRQAVTE